MPIPILQQISLQQQLQEVPPKKEIDRGGKKPNTNTEERIEEPVQQEKDIPDPAHPKKDVRGINIKEIIGLMPDGIKNEPLNDREREIGFHLVPTKEEAKRYLEAITKTLFPRQ